jgi:hypothetical protein
MTAQIVPLRKPAGEPVQARGAAALPDGRPESLPAAGARPARLACDKSDTPPPAAIVGLNGEPLVPDAWPPSLPRSHVPLPRSTERSSGVSIVRMRLCLRIELRLWRGLWARPVR